MRKVLLLVALLAVAFAVTPASAVVSDVNGLPNGRTQGKYTNFSDLYVAPATGAGAMTPLLFGGAVADGMENRAIFNTTSIQTPGGTPLWFPISQQLTGLFYDLNVISHTTTIDGITGDTVLRLDFGASSRSSPLSGPGLATNPVGAGGVLQAYRQAGTTNFTADPNGAGTQALPAALTTTASVNGAPPVSNGLWGPAAWVEGSGATSDTYPGTSGTALELWLSGDFVLFSDLGLTGHTAGTIFAETIDLNTGVGSGTGYLHLIGGSFFGNVGKGDVGRGPEVDMTITADESLLGVDPTGTVFTGQAGSSWSGVGYWPVDSQDPVLFGVTIIPEPATLTLLGLGLSSLLLRRRKA
jgi:hypothetical protein